MVSFKLQRLYYWENSPLDTKLHAPRAGLRGVEGIYNSDSAGIERRFPGRPVIKTFFYNLIRFDVLYMDGSYAHLACSYTRLLLAQIGLQYDG